MLVLNHAVTSCAYKPEDHGYNSLVEVSYTPISSTDYEEMHFYVHLEYIQFYIADRAIRTVLTLATGAKVSS